MHNATGTVVSKAVPLQRSLPSRKPASNALARFSAFSTRRRPANVQRYLEGKFKDALPAAYEAMKVLADAFPPKKLAVEAFHLYEQFRPAVPAGQRGWGAAGTLDLDSIKGLAK